MTNRMDVSLNNMLESTRQYFQGIPIGPGGGANGGGSNMAQQQQQSQQPQLHPQQQQQQQQQQHQQQQQQVVSGGGTAGNGGTGGPGQYHRNQHIQQQQSHYWNASQPQSHHQHQVHHQQQTSQQTNTSSPSVSSYQSQHHHSQPTQSQQHSVSQSNNYYMHHQSHHSSQNVHHQNHNQQTHNLHPSQHNHHQSQSTADHQRVPLAPFSSLGYRSDINNAATGSGVNGPSSNTALTPLKSTSSNHRLEYQQPPVYHQLNGSSQTQNSAHSHQTHQTQQQQQQHRSGFGPSPGYAPYSGPSYSPAQHVAVPQQPPTQQQQQQQLAQHQSHQQSHGHSEQDSRAKVSQHGQQFYQPSRPTPPSVPSPAAAPNINHHPLGPHGMKRESPLDLSVKTIRQSADSTADPPPSSGSDQLFYSFHSELLRNKASGSTPPVYHQMQQQQQQQSQHHHPQSRQQVQSHAVPSKIDYMNSANFTTNNSHLQVQMEKKRRKELQYQYPLPPVNSFTSSNSTNVKQLDMKHYYPAARMQTLSQEIPKYGQQNNYLKRPAEPTEKLPQLQQPLPKLPRTNDSWRQTINQQIEKKFNSYLSSKALNGDVNSRAHNKGQFANCGNIIQANGISTADKRGVLSILRNSLETKDARNQIFQQQLQQQQQQHHHHQQQQHQQQQQQLHQHQQQQQHHHPHPHLQQQQQLHHHQQQLQLQQQQQQQYLSQQQQHHQHLQHKQKQQAASLHNHQQRYAAPSVVPSTPNLPPFEAIAMLERNSVPPYSRLQVPKAVDSIQEFNKFRVPPQQMLQEVVDISDEGEDVLPMQQLPASAPKGELDGLAAFLAARIRTKAELKQVGSNQPDSARSVTPASSTNSLHTSPRATPGFVSPVNNSKDLVKVSGGDTSSNSKCSPWVLNSPKVTKDVNLSRRRLFSRPDEEPGGGSNNNNNNSNSNNNCQDSESTGVVMPPRNPNGLRSSSEASVFDFRDSESESEMPVLERQSLNEMRRVKSREGDLNQDDAEEEHKSWIELCDEFVMQLQFGKNPRKGRRRKGLMEQKTAATSASSVATATITSTSTTVSPTVTSDEVVDAANVTTSTTTSSVACITTTLATITTATVTTTIGTTLSSEAVTTLATSTTVEISSATPVEVIKEEKTVEPVEFASVKCSENNDNNIVKEACDIKKEIVSDNDNSVPAPPSVLELVNGIKKEEVKEEEKSDDSESEQDTKAPMTLRVRKPKVGPKPKVRKRRTVTPKKKKPTITNGCEFEPGWEEELYKYKKSLRMPSGLITISRPSNWPRPPLSLPDMEALPDSPMTADSADSVSPSNHALSKERTLTEEKHYLDRLMARYDARRLAYKERQQKLQKDADSKQQQKEAISSLPTPVSGSISLKSCSGGSDSFKKGSSTESKDDIIKGGSCTGEADLPLKAKSMLWPGKNSVATIREIFGVERPASAPPPGATKEEEELKKGRKKGKKLMVGKRNLLAKESITQNTIEGVTVGPKQVGEKRLKTIRRKLKSSGFDYIRKKKKTQNNSLAGSSKKESGIPGEDTPTRKRKKATPKTEAEIQAEIKSWVLNKGLGETILHRASRVGNYEVVKYCLDKLQHNPAPRDNAGYTPLHEASSKGNYAIASLLLSHGANPSDSALGGVRPLHQAAENGYYKLVKLLLEHGADPQLATYSGYTPLSLAADEEIKQLISLHITNCNTPPPSVTIKSEDGSPSETSQVCEKTDNEFHSKEIIDGFEIEESDVPLPHLYRLSNEPRTDSWVLFHELAPLLHVKTKEALLKQLGQEHQAVLRDMKLSDFFAKAHCRTLRATGASPKMQKVTLVKYTSAVKFLLGVETCVIPR